MLPNMFWHVCVGFWHGVQCEPNKSLLRNKTLVVKFVLSDIPHTCEELGLQEIWPKRSSGSFLVTELRIPRCCSCESQVPFYFYCEAPVAGGPVSGVLHLLWPFATYLKMWLTSSSALGFTARILESCHFFCSEIYDSEITSPSLASSTGVWIPYHYCLLGSLCMCGPVIRNISGLTKTAAAQ